jgi:transposase
LVRIGELLERSGTAVPYRTLARFAAQECGYSSGGPKVTVPVDDGEPGQEVQVDFGYLGMICDGDRKRKLHALVFTAVFSRYCYVYLTFRQTTQAVIAGCEAAWAFYGGVFPVLVPDNLKPVVEAADRLEPRWNREWLEYAQARGIVADPARVASPLLTG